MDEPFLGEIRLIASSTAPAGWALCNGQLLTIGQNQALFSLLETRYGGNGSTTFALPNLEGRVPIHVGNGHTLAEAGGAATITLEPQHLPKHTHALIGSSDSSNATADPTNALLAPVNGGYGPFDPRNDTALVPASVAYAGAGQPHQNVMPFLAVHYMIALQGIFPTRD
jgi:microcystin-dependent protein